MNISKRSRYMAIAAVIMIALVLLVVWVDRRSVVGEAVKERDENPSGYHRQEESVKAEVEKGSAKPEEGKNGEAGNAENGESSSAIAGYLREQEEIVRELFEDMEADVDEEEKDSAELFFLEQMDAHHEAAVEMAQNYLRYAGADGEFRKLAQEIVQMRTKEIRRMDKLEERLEEEVESREGKDDGQRERYREASGKVWRECRESGFKHLGQTELGDLFRNDISELQEMGFALLDTIAGLASDSELLDLAGEVKENMQKIQEEIKKTQTK